MSDINNLTRRQLYDLVWKTPVDKLAKELGITGPGLGKLCKQHSIPVPPRGYWARQAAGRASAPPPLAGADYPPRVAIVMPAVRSPKLPKQQIARSLQVAPLSSLWLEQSKLVGNVHVPQKLSRPHRIIAKWIGAENPRRKDFQKGQRRSHARVEERDVTPLEFRRLRILNALFRHLETIGLSIHEGGAQPDLVVRSEYGEVTFRLGEWVREYRRPLTPQESKRAAYRNRKSRQVEEATGLLEFKITSRLPEGVPDRWQEIDHTIEQMLPEIIAAITTTFAATRQQKEERQAKRKGRLEFQAQKMKLAEEERQAAADRKEVLRKQAAAWREANDLRSFVAAVREATLAGSSFVPKDRLDEWAAWALQHAAELDPLHETKRDEG